MQSEFEVATSIQSALENAPEEGRTLKEILKEALPNVEESSLKQFFSFIVDKKAVRDWNTVIYKGQDVKVVPELAGGY